MISSVWLDKKLSMAMEPALLAHYNVPLCYLIDLPEGLRIARTLAFTERFEELFSSTESPLIGWKTAPNQRDLK
jgi:hypothetical protein